MRRCEPRPGERALLGATWREVVVETELWTMLPDRKLVGKRSLMARPRW